MSMKSKVYFTPVDDSGDINSLNSRFERLLDLSGLLPIAGGTGRTVIKLHFGRRAIPGS